LPNWTHIGTPAGDRSTTRDRLGWPAGSTVVLHAGNMGLKQGLEQVLEFARRADQRSAPILFVLLGDGSQRASLEAKAAGIDRLRFLPFQREEEFPGVLRAADVLLVSERSTVIDMSLPSKLTSYFAAGRPIVAAVPPTGSTAREVIRSGAGIVVPIGKPDELNDVLAQLRADPERSEAMGLAGQAYAASYLESSRALAQVDRLLEQTLGDSSSTRRFGWRRHDAR
jgi:glycosyltransferase involved in cell wall biosynthesis